MNKTEHRVAVLADDLIWSSRLVAAVERSAARALPSRTGGELERLLEQEDRPSAVVIDLNGRTYDGVEQVRRASASGAPVLAVGQHEDIGLRKRALSAGARRVYSYNKLFRDGPQVIADLLAGRL